MTGNYFIVGGDL